MRIQYREPKKLNTTNANLLYRLIRITEDYKNQGYKLTLRQLYYQLVAADIIPNQESSYKKIGAMLAEARMCGQVDWDIIEDRIRIPKMHSEFSGIPELIEAAIHSYRLNRWEGQPEYIEVWVEKDALAGILQPITNEYHIHLMVNKGYSSVSAMHDAAERIMAQQDEKQCTILYFGDHDPSGEDMVRDINDRLAEFGAEVQIDKVALTMTQIQKYRPPPNPVKLTDSRAQSYISEHGSKSWELDALKPQILRNLVITNIEAHLDKGLFNEVKQREKDDINNLSEFASKYRNGEM